MNLFKKKQKTNMLDQMMANALARALADKIMAQPFPLPEKKEEPKKEEKEEECYTKVFVSPIKEDLSLTSFTGNADAPKQKRKYVRKQKQDEAKAQLDTLKPFRDRAAAEGNITPDQIKEYGRVGDVYYIPYPDEDFGGFQAKYSGRLSFYFKTRCTTIYGVNSLTHKAENLLRLELLKKQ